jgi:hypothetical protein
LQIKRVIIAYEIGDFNMRAHVKHNALADKEVLKKALNKAALKLALSRQELSAIVGPSESSLSRIFNKHSTKQNYIEPSSKEGQLAILLLRLYRSLDVLFGGNEKQYQLWLRSENTHLGGAPVVLIQSIEGFIYTIQYLDAIRGKN